MTYFFIDTEFTDMKISDLISLGIVSESGEHEFYIEITDYNKTLSSDFVKKIVEPLLDNNKYGKPLKEASEELHKWLDSLPYERVIFVADYVGDIDLIYKLLALAKINKTKKKISNLLLTKFIMQALHERGYHTPTQLSKAIKSINDNIAEYFTLDIRRHHALVDAKANRHGWLKTLQEI